MAWSSSRTSVSFEGPAGAGVAAEAETLPLLLRPADAAGATAGDEPLGASAGLDDEREQEARRSERREAGTRTVAVGLVVAAARPSGGRAAIGRGKKKDREREGRAKGEVRKQRRLAQKINK